MMQNTNDSEADAEDETETETVEQNNQPVPPLPNKATMLFTLARGKSGELNRYQNLAFGLLVGIYFPNYAEVVVAYAIGRTEYKGEIGGINDFMDVVEDPALAVLGIVIGMTARTNLEVNIL